MTRQEAMDYRRRCPYDAMGDYAAFFEEEERSGGDGKRNTAEETENSQLPGGFFSNHMIK